MPWSSIPCLVQGDGAWEPKERTGKKPTKASSNPKTSSRPTSSNAHAQQSSDAPSSAEDARPVNDPDPNEREVIVSLNLAFDSRASRESVRSIGTVTLSSSRFVT